ncbi:hypothetical protein AQUCO_02500051v1 [Aquilegia coerulea]|uniref:Uncharacterized protein n=1 Tax=Aquilegia coerulea TaxID=218851 RepID=A0A2G5D969_AQUCA|nr:hypothetical protein AQUCO_02500051v1 [Aquilegia coerulea]
MSGRLESAHAKFQAGFYDNIFTDKKTKKYVNMHKNHYTKRKVQVSTLYGYHDKKSIFNPATNCKQH